MASAGVVALEFVINLCRGSQRLLQTVRPNQRRGTVHLIKVKDLVRDIDICRIIVKLLLDQLVTEHRTQILISHGLQGRGIQKRRRLVLHVGSHIIPLSRHLILIQIDFVGDLLFFAHTVFLSALSQ